MAVLDLSTLTLGELATLTPDALGLMVLDPLPDTTHTVVARQLYTPGATRAEVWGPGATRAQIWRAGSITAGVYSPGATAAQTYTPGATEGVAV